MIGRTSFDVPRGRFILLLRLAVLGIAVGAIAFGGCGGNTVTSATVTTQSPSSAGTATTIMTSAPTTAAASSAAASPAGQAPSQEQQGALISSLGSSVVLVTASRSQSGRSYQTFGSGLVYSSDGVIITYASVLDYPARATSVTVTLNSGETLPAYIYGRDEASNIAALKIEKTDLRPVSFATTPSAPGDWVMAIGQAALTRAVQTGRMTGMSGSLPLLGTSAALTGLLETDFGFPLASLGGGLFDSKGELVGMMSGNDAKHRGVATPVASLVPVVLRVAGPGTP